MKLAGKVAVVTGSGHGIGAAIAERFAQEGARVVLADADGEALCDVAAKLDTVGLTADLTDPASVAAVAALARRTYGDIDLWLSNAGISGPADPDGLQDAGAWDLMWRLHVLAHLHAAREVLPAMLARGDGYLIQTASAVALSTQPDKAAYTVTKHGALALSEWLAVRYRPRGIKVSCFCAGPMRTRMILDGGFAPDHFAMRTAITPQEATELVVRGIEAERFLILTRPGTEQALVDKGTDYDAWIDRTTQGWPAVGAPER